MNCIKWIAAGLPIVVWAGCNGPAENKPGHSVSESLAARSAKQTTTAPADSDSANGSAQPAPAEKPRVRSIATVNGEPIDQSLFVRMVIDAKGLPILQQLMVREVARQEAARLKLIVTQDDINREYDVALRGERFNGKDIEALTPARREQMILDWTQSRDVSREELDIAMERQAILRKIAGTQISADDITEEMVQRAYRAEHGEKIKVQHIQFKNQREYDQIKRRLDAGERFEDLVADYSQNLATKSNQGRIPPFSADDDTVPPLLVKASFELAPGGISNPIEIDGYFHVLKLEGRIPADEVPYEDVKEKLARGIRSRLIEDRMVIIGNRLLMAASIQIQDSSLAEEYRSRQKSGRIDGPPLIGQ